MSEGPSAAELMRISSMSNQNRINSGPTIADSHLDTDQEGNAFAVNPQGKGITSRAIFGQADDVVSISGMDIFLGSLKNDAAFNRNPLADAMDGSILKPASGLEAMTTIHHIQGVGDINLGNAAGLPNSVNLAEGISAKDNPSRGQQQG